MKNPQTDLLFDISWSDERTIAFPIPDASFGFHAQQVVEKLLKALICEHGAKYARTHSIAALVVHLQKLNEELPAFPWHITGLSGYAVEFRYDHPVELTEADRKAIRESVTLLRAHVQKRIEQMRAGE